MREWANCFLEEGCWGREKSRCKSPEAGACGQDWVAESKPRSRYGLRGGGNWVIRLAWLGQVGWLWLLQVLCEIGCIIPISQMEKLRHKGFHPAGRNQCWHFNPGLSDSHIQCSEFYHLQLGLQGSGQWTMDESSLCLTLDPHLGHLSLGCLHAKQLWITPSSTP